MSDWFQLRGACEASYVLKGRQGAPVSGCYHLAVLDGAFDSAADTVTMTMPLGPRTASAVSLPPSSSGVWRSARC